MKEVVVHVPTKELAEEVLKYAKEQGFAEPMSTAEFYLKSQGSHLCFLFNEEYFGFCTKEYFKEEGYTVITAEEFLSRYEPKFKPIAMKCNREQFEAVRPKLEKLGKIGELMGAFSSYDYLTNNYGDTPLCFDFISSSASWKTRHKNNVHHDWNEAVFLQHCGDVEEPTELEQLRKENAELKEQLKLIENQPKAGDVCLYWDDEADYSTLMVYESDSALLYDNCEKATPENIEKVIEQIKLNNK